MLQKADLPSKQTQWVRTVLLRKFSRGVKFLRAARSVLLQFTSWMLHLVSAENLFALCLVVIVGFYAGLVAQSKLTGLSGTSVFNRLQYIPSEQPKRLTEAKSNDAFVLRTETKGVAMRLPHVLSESTSGGDERLLVRHWVYKKDKNGTDAIDFLRADDLVAICEIVRTGTEENYDIRVRLAISNKEMAWCWIDIGSGDVDSRLLTVSKDQFSPLRLFNYVLQCNSGRPNTLATYLLDDYLTTNRPTNASAIEICFDQLSDSLPKLNEHFEEIVDGNEDAFSDIMRELTNRIASLDENIRSIPSLFTVLACGGACQAIAFGTTGVVLLFLLLQLLNAVATGNSEIGGDFPDECQATIRLSGLVGTLIYLAAALSCVSVSPDAVKNAVATSQMTTFAGQAFFTTLISSTCVRAVEAVNYVVNRVVSNVTKS